MPERSDTSTAPGPGLVTVRHDQTSDFYEVLVDNVSAGLLVYGLEGHRHVFTHVFINEEYRGRALASLLVRSALDDVRTTGGTVTNYCPVVGRFVDSHPEYRAVIDSGHPGRWRRSKADLSDIRHWT